MQIIENISKLKPRAIDAHKGDFGKVCIIGGCLGFSGAPALAGRSALRAGAGLVRVAVPKGILPIVASIEPSFTTIPLPEDSAGRISEKAVNTILNAVTENDVLAFGPGIGISGGIQSILETLLQQENLRMVIDADGLNNLAKIKNWPQITSHEPALRSFSVEGSQATGLILTPHPGEMKRLWSGLLRDPLPADRTEQAAQFAKHTDTTVVLKGAGTVVAGNNKIYINTTGNPGMATAGSGDCLTGVITALAGQGLSNFDAAVLGVYVHGLAGDLAAARLGQVGLIATDIIDFLPEAFMKG
jgi:NAD(P)H-hydrate epimerase